MIVPILLMFALAAPLSDPLGAALERYGTVSTYRVMLRSGVGDNKETIRYYYKKPGFIRMEFIRPHKGAVLVYDPTLKTVRLRPFGSIPSFVLTLDSDNSLVKSAQGHRVDQSDIGALLHRVQHLREHGTALVLGTETVGGMDAVKISVEGEKGYALEGIHRYLLWLDQTSLLPLKTVTFDNKGDMVEEVLMDDLEVNVPLDDSLFKR